MPGTNAGTGYPLTFRCAKCKVGHWGRAQRGDPDARPGTNVTVLERRPHGRRGLLSRCDRTYQYRYHCLDCGHRGWTIHDNMQRLWRQREATKVFKLNDCDWWAGPDLETTIAAYMKETGLPRDEAVDDPRELTDAEMRIMVLVDGEAGDKDAARCSFKRGLADLIAGGAQFPCFFASTES